MRRLLSRSTTSPNDSNLRRADDKTHSRPNGSSRIASIAWADWLAASLTISIISSA
jgi:hypothetical protein